MAKTTTKPPAKKADTGEHEVSQPKQELVPAQHPDAGVPAHLQQQLAESTGRGVSTARDDNILPLIYILQKGSPCVDERSEAYVEGAKAGEFWVRGTNKVWSGQKGIVVQPCAFLKCWIEWGPKRGDGLKGRHEDRPEDAFEKTVKDDKGREIVIWSRPNGNTLVETREHYVIIDGNPYVLSFTSTGHTVSRTWMALMGGHKDAKGKPYDSFSRTYKLSTVLKSKGPDTWYSVKIDDGDWVPTAQAYALGASLHDAVMSGEKRAEEPSGDETATAEGGDAHAESAGI